MTQKLLHPGTAFIQSLPYREVAFKDMTPAQQEAMFRYMWASGDGAWGETGTTDTIPDAVKVFGDVKFGVGSFPNDDTMKVAFVESTDGADIENPLEWFAEHCICDDYESEKLPVILGPAELAPDFGLFDWGYEWFYGYWVKQPRTEFIRFLSNWKYSEGAGQ